VPTPVGPSHPGPAVQTASTAVRQRPFEPLVTSLTLAPEYSEAAEDALDAARACTAPIRGADAEVPPKTSQPDEPADGVLSYTATPVLGSATALTSASARLDPHGLDRLNVAAM